ncbi:GntR family transcriptional regulator [Actinomadura barringtoniae]|uniref:GntR family transcriptional regulator n=1 Tax=Actinomadura barringtoniae TaxID=1427535 RepID=A0A939PCF4_9ACTN|nr:GntR family transcriptional regulator [Actinomadura barringtoniae]MBO2447498.1 GntR family transcriptional regulator [Actinomadura barringtoniae]
MAATYAAVKSIAPGGLLADRAYEELRAAILESRLAPGTALSVPALADRMNISRSPVREAVQRLIHDGLARHVPHRGAVVTSVDVEDLRQLYVVREQLEGLAARLAAERLDVTALTALEEILAEHGRVVDEGGGEGAHIEQDMRFHQAIRTLSGNDHLIEILDQIQGKAHLGLHSLWRHPRAARLALEEHQKIYDAMAAGDPDAAELAARNHVARLRVRLAQTASAPPARRKDDQREHDDHPPEGTDIGA